MRTIIIILKYFVSRCLLADTVTDGGSGVRYYDGPDLKLFI